jgi:L-cystine uptake protein TcyP (sodium:dicarboxylate symporter family)
MNIACTKASIGDALITVFAFWVVAFIKKSRNWIMKPSLITLGIFLIPGMVITIIFEALATGPLHRWEYAEAMPTLPLLGTGLLPVLQWLILPLISIFIVRRQLRG